MLHETTLVDIGPTCGTGLYCHQMKWSPDFFNFVVLLCLVLILHVIAKIVVFKDWGVNVSVTKLFMTWSIFPNISHFEENVEIHN